MGAAVAGRKKGRGGLRILIVLVVVILIVAGVIVTLGIAAQAETSVGAVVTVFVPNASVSRGGGGCTAATSGTVVMPGDSLKTDASGRAQIQFPDGSITRLATSTQISVDSAHFSKNGSVHDISIKDQIGRTRTSVQHLAGGASFQILGNTTTASVRGTLFEVLVNSDGSVLIKLFTGVLDLQNSKGHIQLTAGQQVSVDANGNIGTPSPIQPDPNDPFGPDILAMTAVEAQTTPGTEEDHVGGLLHNGETQEYTYGFAGGADLKAALAYPGSLMELKITDPLNHVYSKSGPSPIVIVIPEPPAGIYKLDVIGISGLDPNGETPFLSVAASEPCQTSNIEQNGAVRHAYTGSDLAHAVSVSGLSGLQVDIVGNSIAGAIVQGSASYNGVGLTGTLLLYTHGGNLGIVPLAATAFGLSIPAEQAGQQISSALGEDPSNVSIGFRIDRLFTCSGVLMIDGRTAA